MSQDADRKIPWIPLSLALVVVAVALWMYWPRGAGDDVPTMVLTPDSVREQAAVSSTDLDSLAMTMDEDMPDDAAAIAARKPPVENSVEKPADTQVETTKTPAKTTTETAIQTPKTSTEPPAKTPTKVITSPTTTPQSSGEYVLNVGSFKQEVNAQRNAKSLQAKGIPARVVPASGGLWRVRIGYFADADQARRYANWLETSHGLEGWPSKS